MRVRVVDLIDIGEGTPRGAHRYQAEDRLMFDKMIVGTGCGGVLQFGRDEIFMVTRIDTDTMEFDLMPLLAARRYFDRGRRVKAT